MFAKAHFAYTRDHSGVTCPVQGLAEMKVSVDRITGCAPSDRFLPHCGFPNTIISDEIAAVPRVVPSAYGMARRLRRGRNDGGDVVSTGPTTLPALGDSGRRARRRMPRLRDARIRSKLALILVVPVAAVIALATVRLIAVGEGAFDATRARSLTALSVDVSALTQDLQEERMAAAAYLAAPQQPADAYNLRVRQTQQQVDEYRAERGRIGEVPAALRDRLAAIDDHLATLDGTRQEVLDRRQMAVAEAVLRYGVILTDLVSYGDGLAQLPGDESLADSRRAVSAFARAKASVAEEEAVAFTALIGRPARLGAVLLLRGNVDRSAGGPGRLLAGRRPGAARPGRQHRLRRRGRPGRPGGHRHHPLGRAAPAGHRPGRHRGHRRRERPDALGRDPTAGPTAPAGRPGPLGRHPAGRGRVGPGAADPDHRRVAGRGAGPLAQPLAAPAA